MMAPQDHALVVLLEMPEYTGPMDAFIRESTTRVRARLNCAEDEAARLIDNLQNTGEVERRMTPGGQLAADKPIPVAKWSWQRPQNR